jgi:hypothetical protein
MNCNNCTAQAVLAAMLIQLSLATSFVYLINAGDDYSSHTFSLCNRLGMLQKDYDALLIAADLAMICKGKLMIKKEAWTDYLSSSLFDELKEDRPRHNNGRFDLDSALNGTPRNASKRDVYHTVQLGTNISDAACQNMQQQLKATHKPPYIYNLRAKQRAFGRSATPSIVHEICSNETLYEWVMAEKDNRQKRKVVDFAMNVPSLSPPPMKRTKPVEDLITPSTHNIEVNINTTLSVPHKHQETTNPVHQTPAARNNDNIATPSPPSQAQTISSGIDEESYPLVAKIKEALGSQWEDDRTCDLLFHELIQMRRDGQVANVIDKRGHEHTWVSVPVNDTDYSHKKRAKEWIEPILQTNGKNSGKDESARRVCNYLAVHYPDSVMASLKEKKYPIAEYMNETRIAAMFEDAKVNFTQEGVLLKHLRKQFGGKAFSTQKKVRMLCDGHTKVTVGSTKYAYEEGEKEETIEFSYKSLREELEKQIAAEIQKLGLPLSAIKIERVDLISCFGQQGRNLMMVLNHNFLMCSSQLV